MTPNYSPKMAVGRDKAKIGGDVVGRDKVVDNSITVGNVSGTGIAIGPGSSATVIGQTHSVSAAQPSTKSDKYRAIILTALPVGYKVVRVHLTNLKEEIHPQGTIYERGIWNG